MYRVTINVTYERVQNAGNWGAWSQMETTAGAQAKVTNLANGTTGFSKQRLNHYIKNTEKRCPYDRGFLVHYGI